MENRWMDKEKNYIIKSETAKSNTTVNLESDISLYFITFPQQTKHSFVF